MFASGDDLDVLLLQLARGGLARSPRPRAGGSEASASSSTTSVPSRPNADGDLGAGRARADHGEPLGLLLERPARRRVEHAVAELEPEQRLGDRAGGEDHLAGLDLVAVEAAADRTLPSSVSEPWPSIRSILFFLKSPATPPVSVLITLSRCGVDAAEVDRHAPSAVMPNALPCSRLRVHVRRAQDRLRRDARVVEAAPADLVLLDDGGLHARAGRRGWRPRSRRVRSR